MVLFSQCTALKYMCEGNQSQNTKVFKCTTAEHQLLGKPAVTLPDVINIVHTVCSPELRNKLLWICAQKRYKVKFNFEDILVRCSK